MATIIPVDFKIVRDSTTGKKTYYTLGNKPLSAPAIPKNWQHTTDYQGITYRQAPAYIIRCDDDLIVVDCDDQETTDYIDSILVPSTLRTLIDGIEHYIVQSDKGFRHYYFTPTEYYLNSPLYKGTRLALGKIDVLHGRSLVFAPNANNDTKTVLQGLRDTSSILGYYITPIPDNIVDALVARLTRHTAEFSDDYTPLTSYLAPLIEQGLALYGRSRNYIDIQPLLQLLTPARYKDMVKPDFNPNRVHDGDGISYLQAMSTKLAQDPSVSVALHREVIELVSQQLWSDPLSDAQVTQFLSNLTTQTYAATGKTIFKYDPNATLQPLVSVNGYSYMPVYRTLDDDYIVTKPAGGAEIIPGTSNFKRAMSSKNYEILVNSQRVNLDTNIAMKKVQDAMKSCRLVTLAYKNSGEFEDDGSLYYNLYVATKYLSIVRGTYQADKSSSLDTWPTIKQIISNLVFDHSSNDIDTKSTPESNKQYRLFLEFLSHKLKTLEYSPLVFQLMGNRGVGKGLLMAILEHLTQATTQVSFSASNSQFNAHTEGKMFLNEDEGLVTQRLVNMAKKISGSKTTMIEKKGVDAMPQRNIGTYIFSTNKETPMAETADDRRFITFSSFKAPQLQIRNVETLIVLELEEFALYLRDLKISTPEAYVNAKLWHDQVHYANFEELTQTTQHLPSRIANFVFQLQHLSGREIHEQLTDMLGQHYHYLRTKKSPCTIGIPLAQHPRPVRASDKSELTHEVTRAQLKGVELDRFIVRDANPHNNGYCQRIYKLVLELSVKQMAEWEASLEGYEDISALGDIDLA